MTELTDRMRTCAAHMLAGDTEGRAGRDAIDLLIEASNILELRSPPLGEPMPIIPPVASQTATSEPAVPAAPRQGTPPPRPRTCPKCDSRAAKRVRRQDKRIMLTCPVCSHDWPYVPDGIWG
jgi:hypothetical protein